MVLCLARRDDIPNHLVMIQASFLVTGRLRAALQVRPCITHLHLHEEEVLFHSAQAVPCHASSERWSHIRYRATTVLQCRIEVQDVRPK